MTNKTTITLTAEQISLLLQTFTENLAEGRIYPSEYEIADEIITILEDAENLLCDIENRINLGI
jgi:hypothetical protein